MFKTLKMSQSDVPNYFPFWRYFCDIVCHYLVMCCVAFSIRKMITVIVLIIIHTSEKRCHYIFYV